MLREVKSLAGVTQLRRGMVGLQTQFCLVPNLASKLYIWKVDLAGQKAL